MSPTGEKPEPEVYSVEEVQLCADRESHQSLVVTTEPLPPTPAEVGEAVDRRIEEAAQIATRLKKIIDKQGLAVQIQHGAEPHVRYEGWIALAELVNLTVVIVKCEYEADHGDGIFGYRATAELRDRKGMVVASATSGCYSDEPWGKRKRYTMESMAQTRAGGKVCRVKLSWIMALAGYEVTPAEEMTSVNESKAPGPSPAAAATPQAGMPIDWDAMKKKLIADYHLVMKDSTYRPAWIDKPIMFGKMKGSGYVWSDAIGKENERAKKVRQWIHACQAMGLKRADTDGWDPGDWTETTQWAPHEIAGRIVLSINSWVQAAQKQREAEGSTSTTPSEKTPTGSVPAAEPSGPTGPPPSSDG